MALVVEAEIHNFKTNKKKKSRNKLAHIIKFKYIFILVIIQIIVLINNNIVFYDVKIIMNKVYSR